VFFPILAEEGMENCIIGENLWIVEDDGAVENDGAVEGDGAVEEANEYLKNWIKCGI
jgi:hypothetical protein